MFRREEPLVSSLEVREVREVSKTCRFACFSSPGKGEVVQTWFMDEWEAENEDFE